MTAAVCFGWLCISAFQYDGPQYITVKPLPAKSRARGILIYIVNMGHEDIIKVPVKEKAPWIYVFCTDYRSCFECSRKS